MQKKKKYLAIVLLILIVSVLLTTYAFFGASIINDSINNTSVLTGNIELTINDATVNLTNMAPIYDEYYLSQAYKKEFTVTSSATSLNTCSGIYLNFTSFPDELKSEYLKYKIVSSDNKENEGNFTTASTTNSLQILNSGYFTSNQSNSYTLYIWLSYDENVNQNSLLNKSFTSNIVVSGIDSRKKSSCDSVTLTEKILEDNTAYADNVASPNVTASTGINFADISSDTNGKGLYYTDDNDKTDENNDGVGHRIYYYRGAVENNYLIFAGYCWRIVRTNEDGSVKLRYGGTPTEGACPQTGTDVSIGTSTFNTAISDNRYIGYMYGSTCTSYATCHSNTNNSAIKDVVDNWFDNNIENQGTEVSALIIDAVFCNDRSISTKNYVGQVANSKLGYGINNTFYGVAGRLINESSWTMDSLASPQFKCPSANTSLGVIENNNRFSVSSSIGNAKLSNPVGLLTGDEISYAGCIYPTANQSNYLNAGVTYWTMSPHGFAWSAYALNYIVSSTGGISDSDENSTHSVIPVISIISSANVSIGTGEYNNPYIIE